VYLLSVPGNNNTFDFSHGFHAALDSSGLSSFITKALNKTHLFFNLDLLPFSRSFQHRQVLFPGLYKLIIAAVKKNHIVFFNGDNLFGDPIEKSTVMGSDHHGSLIGPEIIFKPDT